MTPVAKLKTVNVGGVNVSNCTLHNFDELKRLDPRPGDGALIKRAGDVIPKMVEVIPKKKNRSHSIKIPKKCPCGKAEIVINFQSEWTIVDTNTSKPIKRFSSSYEAKKFLDENQALKIHIAEERFETPFMKCSGGNNCPEIFQGKFTHFVSRKAMDIDGLGQEILLTLINQKFIKDFADLYSLKDHRSELEKLERFGKKSVDNLIKSIKKSTSVELHRLIFAIGIEEVGETTSRNLANYFGGTFHSVGNLFREVAAKRGITVAEQAKLLLTERGIDVEIDYKTCEMISGEKISTNLGVIEGRQPAYMGSFMENLGKKNIVRIYFQCSIRDQALRFLRREIGEDAYTKGLENVPDMVYDSLESLKDEIFNLGLAESDDVVERFIENQDRDNDDRARYSSLYGFDYGNLDGYDIVINTTNKEADFVFKEVVSELEKSRFRTN